MDGQIGKRKREEERDGAGGKRFKKAAWGQAGISMNEEKGNKAKSKGLPEIMTLFRRDATGGRVQWSNSRTKKPGRTRRPGLSNNSMLWRGRYFGCSAFGASAFGASAFGASAAGAAFGSGSGLSESVLR